MTKPRTTKAAKQSVEVDEDPPSRKKKTADQRLREIRRIVNETDTAIEGLHASEGKVKPRSMLGGPEEPDQLTILRGAMARIVMVLGPAIDPKKNMR